SGPIEEELARIWAEVLGLERVGAEDNFFELGGDSILSIQVVSRARQDGLRLTTKEVFIHQTIAQLAPVVSAEETIDADQNPPAPSGPAPLTPIQHWFLETEGDNPHHFNQSVFVELAPDLDELALRRAVEALIAQHDALRMRFSQIGDQWLQEVAAAEPSEVFVRHDLSGLGEDAQRDAMEQTAVSAQSSLDVAAGPLLRAVLFVLGPGRPPRLFLTVHHLVVDGVSWRILLGDLEVASRQAAEGRPVELEPVGTPFAHWARRFTEHVRSGALDDDLPYWTAVSASVPAGIPVDREGTDGVGAALTVSAGLDRATTERLLHDVPGVYRTQVNDVLLSALSRVLCRWAGQDGVLVALEGHGREEILDGADLSRTVGWFTSRFPVALRTPPSSDWGETIKSVKEQLRAVPRRGLSYEALRYLSPPDSPASVLRAAPLPRISVNYLGRWDVERDSEGFYGRWHEGIGQDAGPGIKPAHLLDITGVVSDGELRLSWSYHQEAHDETTVRRLAQEVVEALREIVEYCSRPEAGGCTPSDFPLARLSQRQVDRIAGDGRAVEDIYPLTPLQAGMLFHSLVDSASGAYLDQFRMRLSGVSDPHALAEAWQRVVDRNPILRSHVAWDGVDEPVQVVRRRVAVPTAHHDWRALSGGERDRELRRVLAEDRAAGMDLAEPPLIRLVIGRVTDDEVLLVWTSHHILLDGWSAAAVFAEVCEQYAAIVGGRQPELVARRPFRDYLRWLRDQDGRQAEDHWRRELSGFESPTPLPYDRQPVEAHRAVSSDSVRVDLGAEAASRLQGLAKGNGLTLNTIVQGAWGLLLSRYSGENDVVFGTTVSGRPAELPGVESMIGMFINTVPTRVAVRDGKALVAWLRELQLEQSESRRFDGVSLSQLQSWSDLPAGANLFDSLVVFENYPIGGDAVPGGPRVVEVDGVDTTSFALTLTAYVEDRLHLVLDYDPNLFDTATVERMAGHLSVVLEGMTADPDRPPTALSLLSGPERETLKRWSGTDADVPSMTLPELFEAQAAATPDATALVFDGAAVSFAELDERANRLAGVLAARGAGPEKVVALALPRSAEMVVAILAVFKAGAVYLPVDPDLPGDRVRFLLADSRATLAVTTSRTGVEAVASLAEVATLVLDSPQTLADLRSAPLTDSTRTADTTHPADVTGSTKTTDAAHVRRLVPPRPGDAAYMIYTSGSTGEPKAVVVEHRGLVNLLASHRAGFVAEAGGGRLRAALTAVFSFDTSLEGLLLMADGHELHLIDDAVRLDPAALVGYVAEHRVDFLDLTPSYLRQLLAAGLLDDEPRGGEPRGGQPRGGQPGGAERHRPGILMLGGEALDESLWRRLAETEGTTSYNFYGPTECTIDALYCRVSEVARPAVGRPLENLRAYVLDDDLQMVPVGVRGELYLAGPQV
ncbi:condensation domain-containing protein, partial [Planotetraspora sp. A-T 1434]|uniref:condensation domain-containing protein n=1 Tax=Planotetraspora sp. A-T 1434 TaxID=2979219 RepID=UPI0021C01A9A